MATENGTYIWDVDKNTYVNIGNAIGATGPQGPAGKDGTVTFESLTPEQKEEIRGPQGIQGPKGDKGDPGRDGIDGRNGIDGEKGDTGPQGIQGIQGPRGSDGVGIANIVNKSKSVIINDDGHKYTWLEFEYTDGTFEDVYIQNGDNGVDGKDGKTGPQGPAGKDGTNGTNGTNGIDGPQFYPIYSIEIRNKYIPGDTLYDPILGRRNAGDSIDKPIKVGDFVLTTGVSTRFDYVENLTLAGDILVCIKAGNIGVDAEFNWVTKLEGSKGEKGDAGPQGPQGVQGIQGQKGDTGPRGPQGIQGPQGVQGPGFDTYFTSGNLPSTYNGKNCAFNICEVQQAIAIVTPSGSYNATFTTTKLFSGNTHPHETQTGNAIGFYK